MNILLTWNSAVPKWNLLTSCAARISVSKVLAIHPYTWKSRHVRDLLLLVHHKRLCLLLRLNRSFVSPGQDSNANNELIEDECMDQPCCSYSSAAEIHSAASIMPNYDIGLVATEAVIPDEFSASNGSLEHPTVRLSRIT